ncbi:hypothetical protein BH09PSE5_BH09PSE5_03370 [soil metagenome]
MKAGVAMAAMAAIGMKRGVPAWRAERDGDAAQASPVVALTPVVATDATPATPAIPAPMPAVDAVPKPALVLPPWLRSAALPLLVFVLFVAFWQVVTVTTKLPATTLPSPLDVLSALAGSRGPLLAHALHTTLEAVCGFALASTLGIGIGLAMNSSQWLREMIYPNLVALQVIPKIALAPVFIVWFGIGFESKLLLATFISFFPVAIGTTTGLMETDAGALKLCRALGATKRQTLLRVRLPYALPFMFSGLKVASTMAMIGVIVGEFISSQRGLGYFILNASSRIDTPQVLAAIAVLCIAGMGMYALTDLLERAVRKRWWPQ